LKAIIVGGGVIGMMQARVLVKTGYEVVVIERGELGREASWAGGGIISPLYPWRYAPPVTALAIRSQQLYPELVAEIAAESGVDPEYSGNGLLMLNVEDEREAKNWSKEAGPWLEDIDATALYELEPNLAPGIERSLWMPRVASIRNPRLLRALRQIMREHQSIEVREHSPVKECGDGYVVLTSGERIDADLVAVCSGAWTSELLRKPALGIAPVKGQMVVFDAPKGLLNRVVLTDGRYVIPRKDGKIVAGSTLEYTGFEKDTTEDAKASLAASAIHLLPALENYKVIHHWAGLRPGSRDGIPMIGLVPGKKSLYINAGHFRNGLVLAPASVELLGSIIAKQTTKVEQAPYIPRPEQAH
jgi:glycine oxidase